MTEPMLTDLAEAVRLCDLSAAAHLAARVAGHAHAQFAAHTSHRWLKLEEPRYM